MKPNPGGQLAPNHIFGRDTLIAHYWEILEGRCIYVNDLRRIGKTQIMVKMHAEPPSGWLTVKRDLGGCHTAAEFATLAFRDSTALLGLKKRNLRRMGEFLKTLGGGEIAGILKLPDGSAAPWKEVLFRTFSDLEEEMRELNSRVVFFWDEMPFLLDNIARREGTQTAMEVLDVLRSLSQDHDRIRLFLTGSIGLHHILSSLHKDGYINSPLNRMEHAQPGPLGKADACRLAQELIAGSALQAESSPECAACIADETGNVAYYIHLLISRLPTAEPLTPDLIRQTLKKEITADDNDWDFEHYRKRLKTYYGAGESAALRILDTVAVTQPVEFQVIRRELAGQMSFDDERLRELLKLLCRDYYLVRTGDNQYRFYLDIIRRWWVLSRNL